MRNKLPSTINLIFRAQYYHPQQVSEYLKTANAGVTWGSQTHSLCRWLRHAAIVTGRTYLFNYEQQRDSGTPNTLEEGGRSPAGQPDVAPPAVAVRVCIDPEWHCGNDKKRDQEAESGESLREIHSGNASVPPALGVGILA